MESQEHWWIGLIGQSFVIAAFVAAIVAFVGFVLKSRLRNNPEEAISWGKLGKLAYWIHVVSTLAVVFIVFYMFVNHYFEYEYIYKHSSKGMSFKYILVSFWGGQQGSLMLWSFWHVVLSIILYFSAKEWRSNVLAVFMLVQAFVSAMLLGIEVFGYKLGVSPFTLVRHLNPDFGPLWARIPDYLAIDPTFQDGRGLTPSLQNYWMIIHPPTLFLGFALTLVPAAYAFAGLWKKDFSGWVKPALPWAYLAIGILGTGILMGGAWAYESLNFGGFWAWDPVENASLVPWIILVGGAHVMIINQRRGTARFSSAYFIITAFLFVIYSSFLTRSGVLGDSSVHSFTGDGMSEEFLIMQGFFWTLMIAAFMQTAKWKGYWYSFAALLLVVAAVLPIESTKIYIFGFAIAGIAVFSVISYVKGFPKDSEEEALWSREFWIFVGTLILFVAAFHIIISTSLPALGKVFDTDWKLYGDNIERNQFYNKWQTLIAIFFILIIGFSQYLKYKRTNTVTFFKNLIWPVALSIVLTIVTVSSLGFNMEELPYIVLIFSCWFAIWGNLDYWIRLLRGKWNHTGATIAHIGFALIILGAVIANGKQEVISKNTAPFVVELMSADFNESEDIQLIRKDTIELGPYFVHYKGEFFEEPNKYYYHFEYFDKEKAHYNIGDRVRVKSMVFEATKEHEAGQNFDNDHPDKWQIVKNVSNKDFYKYPVWRSNQPTSKAFDITPRVLVDVKRFEENFPEPGTKHFWDSDVFTHVRYADLTPLKVREVQNGEEGDNYMAPFGIEGKVGDTLLTPGYVLILDDAFIVPDSLKEERNLLPNDRAVALQLRAFEIRDRQYARGLSYELLQIKRDGTLDVPDEVTSEEMKFKMILDEVSTGPELDFDDPEFESKMQDQHVHIDSSNIQKMRARVDSIQMELAMERGRDTSVVDTSIVQQDPLKDAVFKIQVAPEEYVVLKAIVFPYINILWVGIIVMFIGTILAVIYRWTNKKKK